MAISIDWDTRVILVPKTYTTLVQSSPFEVRELDTNQFRLDLKALEADVEGMPFPITHVHNTEVILSGITYARFIELVNNYTVEFENGQYGVSLAGSNSNILDVKVANEVSLLANNSAGQVVTPAAIVEQNIADAVWNTDISAGTYTNDQAGGIFKKIKLIFKILLS